MAVKHMDCRGPQAFQKSRSHPKILGAINTNTRCHLTKFSHQRDLTPGICVPLRVTYSDSRQIRRRQQTQR
jgi:hypothetical protein